MSSSTTNNGYTPLSKLGHTHYRDDTSGPTHLTHLLFPIAWEHGQDAFLEMLEAVRQLAVAESCSVAFGGSAAYDVLVHPGWPSEIRFRLIPNVHVLAPVRFQPGGSITNLIPLVGNNGCGPEDEDELLNAFADAESVARRLNRPVPIGGYCGLYEPVVRPNGWWVLTPHLGPELRTCAL